MAWTTTQLLAEIRRVASVPTASTATGYADSDLLVHADAALQGIVAPMVANARDEHAVHTVDVAVAAGQATTRLPPRVAAGRLRDVTVLSSDGQTYINVPRFEPEDIAGLRSGNLASPLSVSVVVQGGFLRIFPQPTSAMTFRISYVRTPSPFALVSTCTQATGFIAGTPQFTAQHAGTLVGATWDFVMLSNGDSLGDSVPAVIPSVGSTTFTASAMSPMFINATAELVRYRDEGVYFCPAGTSCIVPLPDMASSLLAYHAAINLQQAIGDLEASTRTERIAQRMTEQLLPLLSERIEGEPQTIVPQLHRRGRNWRW
jgi:hypothetical protein